ncbi:hypothetical protein [Sphingobium limneticum]|jgi:hypothetical protein|uniref:Uncharacterized protein n=1 Tax=Sphingobium limneticum TaxID=1007511 RepID=A0A5J5I8Z1_9SPHN|nr:hypothetical protein [Sphingobium limneticum]KAA9018859.1 hypothetical protein F4U96_07425 [Sphingobium limneticum]KAA9031433.1 hypothetical protein F4U95_07375 [Sphingobium limneticum]
MTSINSYTMNMPPSPRAMMDRKIGAAVEAGSLSQVDGDALETALDSIGSALSSSASDSSARLDPSGMKDRIDSMIDDQVSAGTLTEDQASALQSFFAQGPGGSTVTADAGGEDQGFSIDGMGGVGGPGAMRGPPPGPPPSGSSDDGDDSSTTSSTDATSATDQLDSIIAFLENLRSSLSQSLYGSVASSTDSSNSGLVIDSLA